MKNDTCHVTLPGHAVELMKDMHHLQREGALCDVKLTTTEGHVMAHKVVLSAASPYFRERIACIKKADDPFLFHIDDTDISSLNCLVNILYAGEMHVQFEDMPNFIKLCRQLMLLNLVEKCKKLLENVQTARSDKIVDNSDTSISTNINKKCKEGIERKVVPRKRKKKREDEKANEYCDIDENLYIIDKVPIIKIPKLSIRLPVPRKENVDELDSVRKTNFTRRKDKNVETSAVIEIESVKDFDNESENKDNREKSDKDFDFKDEINDEESDSCCMDDDVHNDSDYEECNKYDGLGNDDSEIKKVLKVKKMHTTDSKLSIPKSKSKSALPKDCSVCGIVLNSSKEFKEHMKSHKILKPKKKRRKQCWPCTVCSRTLTSEVRQACHLYGKHGVPYDPKFKIHTCTYEGCNYTTASKNYLLTHVRGRHGNERPHVCEFCGKGFKLPSALWTHLNIHTNANVYQCKECDLTFNQKGGLDYHKKKHHDGQESWTELCHLCSEKFLQKAELVWHMFQAHQIPVPDRYKLYSCTLCDFKSINRVKLERHMDAHNDTRSFVCTLCGKKFVTKSYLNRHMTYHGEKKFKCTFEDCTYACVDKLTLSKHTRLMHTHKNFKPFLCTICPYRTGLRGNLDKHIRTVHNLEVVTKHTVNLKMKFKGHNSGDIITKDGKFVQKVLDVSRQSNYNSALCEDNSEDERIRSSGETCGTPSQITTKQNVRHAGRGKPPQKKPKSQAENTTTKAGDIILSPESPFESDTKPLALSSSISGDIGEPVSSNQSGNESDNYLNMESLQFKYQEYY